MDVLLVWEQVLMAQRPDDPLERDFGDVWREYFDDSEHAEVVVAEGKTKIIIDNGDGTVTVRSKDDLTAGDGAKHIVMEDKGAAATETTCNVFELLKANGLPVHYLGRVADADNEFVARKLDMIPVEVVVRHIATGSCVQRWDGVEDGDVLAEPVIEFFGKRDFADAHDPLLFFDYQDPDWDTAYHYRASGEFLGAAPLVDVGLGDVQPEVLEQISLLAKQAAAILEWAWAQSGITFWDLKLEFGFDAETGELVIGDVIDNDSWRIKDSVGRHLDKQLFRDGSATDSQIRVRYLQVAQLSRTFEALKYRPFSY